MWVEFSGFEHPLAVERHWHDLPGKWTSLLLNRIHKSGLLSFSSSSVQLGQVLTVPILQMKELRPSALPWPLSA